MAAYTLTPVSLNGVSINTASIRSYWDADDPSPFTAGNPVEAVESEIAGLGARDVRGQPKAATWLLTVELTSLDEADMKTFRGIFNEQLGTVLLRLIDGAGVTWRVQVRVLGTQRVMPSRFKVPLRVARPILEADAQTTNSQLNQAGNTISPSLDNTGTREARPILTVVPDQTKISTVDDYYHSFRAIVVNRAPNAWVDLPVYLCDQSGSQARISTAALVKTGTTTTLSGAHTAGATTINVASAAAFPTRGMGYITNGANSEQIWWSGKGGTTLTGVTRGIGGTVGFAHSGGQTIAVSEALANGDDCRVWVNDVETEDRYLVTPAGTAWADSTASDIVINMSMPAGVQKTLVKALTAADTAMDFVEGAANLDPEGFLAFTTGAGINEIIYYGGRTDRGIFNVVRGVWGSTAASQLTTVQIWAKPQFIVCAIGKATAPAASARISRRPAIQLPGSQNLNWKWGDQADDASTVYYDKTNPDRTAQWSLGFDLDGNDIAPLIRVNSSSTILTFADNDPGDGTPPNNFAEIYLPQGIRTGGSMIVNDWTPAVEVLNLELFTRDSDGTLKLQDELQQSAAAAARASPALTAVGYGVKLKARYNITTGFRGKDDGSQTFNNTTDDPDVQEVIGQKFVIDQQTRVDAIAIRGDTAAGTTVVRLGIFADNGDKPDSTKPIQIDCGSATFTTTPTTHRVACGPFLLTPGTYWLVAWRSAFTNSTRVYYTFSTNFIRGGVKQHGAGAGVWNELYGAGRKGIDLTFYIMCDYDNAGNAPVQDDQPVLNVAVTPPVRTGTTASFDKSSILFPVAPPSYPYVHRYSGFTNGLYHCAATVTNTTTGDELDIDRWMDIGSSLAIDCEQRTAVYVEDNVEWPAAAAVTPLDASDWLKLAAGANAVSYAEANMRQTDLVTTFRPAR